MGGINSGFFVVTADIDKFVCNLCGRCSVYLVKRASYVPATSGTSRREVTDMRKSVYFAMTVTTLLLVSTITGHAGGYYGGGYYRGGCGWVARLYGEVSGLGQDGVVGVIAKTERRKDCLIYILPFVDRRSP